MCPPDFLWSVKLCILSLIPARCVPASPRTVETAFSAAPLLWWLCVSDTCRRICQSCPSGRHSFATLSSSNWRTPSLSPCTKKRSYPSHAPTRLLLRQRKACPSSWSRAPWSRGWLQNKCLFPRRSTLSVEVLHLHVPIIKLKLRYNSFDFRLFSMWWFVSSGFDTHLAPGLTRKMIQIVLFSITIWSGVPGSLSVAGRASIGSSTSSSICGPIGICNSWATSSLTPAVVKGATSVPLTKNKLSSLCNYVASFRLGLVKKEQCSNICTKITPIHLLSETAKRLNWFLNFTRVDKYSNCSSFWKFCLSPVVLRHVGVLFHLLCGFQDQATVSFVLDTRVAVRHCKEANTRHQLVSLWMTRNWLPHPWSTAPRLNCTRVIQWHRCLWRIRHSWSCFRTQILFRFAFLRVAVTSGGTVIRSSTRSPAVLRPVSSHATVLARVDVCRAGVGRAGRAISSLVEVFALALSLAFLGRVDLNLVIICAGSISSWHGRIRSKISGRLTEERHCWRMYPTANCF